MPEGVISGFCPTCNGKRDCRILSKEDAEDSIDYESGWHCSQSFFILKCCGCRTLFFCRQSRLSQGNGGRGNSIDTSDFFPSTNTDCRHFNIPTEYIQTIGIESVDTLRDVYKAYNNGIYSLSAIGMRTFIEQFTQFLYSRSYKKISYCISALVANNHITIKDKDTLDSLRKLGNSVVHGFYQPSREDISSGLDVIERILSTLFIQRDRAEELENKLQQNKSKFNKQV